MKRWPVVSSLILFPSCSCLLPWSAVMVAASSGSSGTPPPPPPPPPSNNDPYYYSEGEYYRMDDASSVPPYIPSPSHDETEMGFAETPLPPIHDEEQQDAFYDTSANLPLERGYNAAPQDISHDERMRGTSSSGGVPPTPDSFYGQGDDLSDFSRNRRGVGGRPPRRYDEEDSRAKDPSSSFPSRLKQQQQQSSSSSSSPGLPRLPIHYEFQAKQGGDEAPDESTFLSTTSEEGFSSKPRVSARQDAITLYMQTTSGKLKVHSTSTLVGAGMGIFLSKSFLPFPDWMWASSFGTFFAASSIFLRTPWGELVRAVALSLLFVLQRTQTIRKRYPTWRYVPSAIFRYTGISAQERRARYLPPPFPPARNPWRYAPRRPSDAEFNMMYSMIAMAMVGSVCGGNLPMIPTWMGSLAGASSFALGCTLTESPRGDLFRTCGMRVVALVQELWDIQAKLGIVPKAAVVSGQVIDRIMILDRQHRVKDKFLYIVNKGYESAMNTAQRVQQQRLDAQGRGGEEGDFDDDRRQRRQSGPPAPRRDEDDRRRRRPVDLDRDAPRRRGPPSRGNDDFDDEDRFHRGPRRERPPTPPRRKRDSPRDDFDDYQEMEAKPKRGWFGR